MELSSRKEPFSPLDVVMLFIFSATLAGGYLLLSAAESLTLVDGAVEWQAESALRAVVQLLCLNYRFPTLNAGDIKGYILGVGTALALLAIAAALWRKSESGDPTGDIKAPSREPALPKRSMALRQFSPAALAQLVMLLFVLWSFASSRWSTAPELAVGGSLLLAIQVLWALAIANGLSLRAAHVATKVILIITAATGLVAIWYYYGRNPTLRAKFPFGNPTFLSACLIPGITIGLSLAAGGLIETWKQRRPGPAVWMIAGAVVALPALWAFSLADSRASKVGLGAGLLAIVFFAVRGKWKLTPVAAGIVLAAAGWFHYSNTAANSRTGRGDSLLLRAYAWGYAGKLIAEKPIIGHGQGGYATLADSFAADDVLENPLVFEARIDHAHNEWLEVVSDLGIVGLALLAGGFWLTLHGGVKALGNQSDLQKWSLVGFLAAMVGLMTEETAGVGLRVSEVPVAFFTVLGIVWAMSVGNSRLPAWVGDSASRRGSACTAGLLAACGIFLATQLDFDAARAGYQISDHFAKGEHDMALVSAERARRRLSPQRDLVSRLRLAEAHVLAAERAVDRAADRERRARSAELPDDRLLALAQSDMAAAEEGARAAGHELKELIERSPGFMDSGFLEYRIHLLRAQLAHMRGNSALADASRQSAEAAIDRELLRQPFSAELSVAYAQVAAGAAPADRLRQVLARPLRYGRITDRHLVVLQHLPEVFDLERAESATLTPEQGVGGWRPETLRLSAAVAFLRGDYEKAVQRLQQAAGEYEGLSGPPPLGAAACFAELAEALFYADPGDPQRAVDRAERAIALAPHSRLGRDLQSLIRQRLVYYELAWDHESQAVELLRKSAPEGVSPAILQRELGVRYRRLCESLLLNRREAMILRKPADDLFPKLEQWLSRAIQINPDDFVAHLLAADLAVHAGDEAAGVRHLREALRAGLGAEEAKQFLRAAMERLPGSPGLESLLVELAGSGDLASERLGP